MTKYILAAVLLFASAFNAMADDLITRLNGEEIKAKVIEIGDNTVKYKRMDNPTGPVYTLSLSEVQSIAYENGLVENYNEPVQEPKHYVIESYDVRYRDISSRYNPRNYRAESDDPYIPALSGIASFCIPGLGQCIDGEWGRGLGIMTVNVGFGLLELTEASLMFYSAADGSSYYRDNGMTSPRANALFGASFCAALLTMTAQCAFNIWNICDAVNIAKVKNMYYQDVRVAPQLAFTPSFSNGLQPTAGLSLTLSF